MVVNNLEVEVNIVAPGDRYQSILYKLMFVGHEVGLSRHGNKKWHDKCHPSEEKLRIYSPPSLTDRMLRIEVIPFEWSDLQACRQLQPIGDFSDDFPLKYWINAVALTANGLIETDDKKLVFHQKKGGAKSGSVHTFGGYVSREDIEKGGSIKSAIIRELTEMSEIGLKPGEMEIKYLFGTPEGKPSILWDFGTGAIYGVVKTPLTSLQLQDRMREISADESLSKTLYIVNLNEIGALCAIDNLHPQTKKVLPTIMSLYQ